MMYFPLRGASLCSLVGIHVYHTVPKSCSWSSEGIVPYHFSCDVMLSPFDVVRFILVTSHA